MAGEGYSPKEGAKSWPDVAYRLIDGVFAKPRSGEVVLLLPIAALVVLGILAYRTPESDLRAMFGPIIEASGPYVISGGVCAVLIGYCVVRCWRMKNLYTDHIRRLTDTRKKLVHGIGNGTLTPLKKHSSSQFDIG